MLKESLTVDEAINFLNEALKLDREAMSNLFLRARVSCSPAFADHPTIQVGKTRGQYDVGILGILNGLFGVDKDSCGALSLFVTTDDAEIVEGYPVPVGTIIRFGRTPPRRDKGDKLA